MHNPQSLQVVILSSHVHKLCFVLHPSCAENRRLNTVLGAAQGNHDLLVYKRTLFLYPAPKTIFLLPRCISSTKHRSSQLLTPSVLFQYYYSTFISNTFFKIPPLDGLVHIRFSDCFGLLLWTQTSSYLRFSSTLLYPTCRLSIFLWQH